MQSSRREFLKATSIMLGASILRCGLPALAYASPVKGRRLVVGSSQSVCAIDLFEKKALQVPVGFLPHGFAQNPLRPNRIWTIEKWGSSAAEIDVEQQEVIATLKAPNDTQFFGHGLFSPKGDVLFIVRADMRTGKGHCIGYDATSYEPVLDYQVTPGGLHESRLLPDGTFLVASNGAPVIIRKGVFEKAEAIEKSSLVHVESKTGKILDKKFISDIEQVIGHFVVTNNGTIVALSSPRRDSGQKSGAIYLGHIKKPNLKRVDWGKDMDSHLSGEMLSVAVSETDGVAMVTNPGSSTLLFIDLRDGAFMGSIHGDAHGVSFDRDLGKFIATGSSVSLVNGLTQSVDRFELKDSAGREFHSELSGAHSIIADIV